MLSVMKMMQVGALTLVRFGREHTDAHAAAGFSRQEWDLLTCDDMWTAEQQRQVRSILAEAVNVSLTLANLPSDRLPGQYVAAIIAQLVSPCNRLVAARKAPETYDAVAASGLVGPVEVIETTPEQMVALVMAYSSGEVADLPGHAQSDVLEQARQQPEK